MICIMDEGKPANRSGFSPAGFDTTNTPPAANSFDRARDNASCFGSLHRAGIIAFCADGLAPVICCAIIPSVFLYLRNMSDGHFVDFVDE
jgi:hypothetical protein